MRALIFASSISLLAACATTDTVDELAGESTYDDAATGKADGAVDGSYTYFKIERDLRRCASPMCGGFFLARLNRSTTTCVDGTSQASCYAPVLDWSETDLGESRQLELVDAASRGAASAAVYGIVRGRFAKTNDTVRPELGRFVVSEAWVGEGTGVADGVFARIKDAGVRCIAAPCASTREKGLNKSATAMIAGLDFAPAGLPDYQLQRIYASMYEPSGIIVAGDRYTIHENGRTAKGRTVTQAYRRLVAPASAVCHVGGCSGEVCSAQEGVITTCDWHEEYACYLTAACEPQADGACGWTPSGELDACLGN